MVLMDQCDRVAGLRAEDTVVIGVLIEQHLLYVEGRRFDQNLRGGAGLSGARANGLFATRDHFEQG